MTNNTIPFDHHHHPLRPHHQEMDQLQPLAAVKPQAKRQARRRTHASRPYQERLLNMAEARREIVTALKIHRASTSTSRQQHHQQSTYYQHRHHQEPQPPIAQQLQQQQQDEQQQQQVQVQALAFQDRSQPAVDEEAALPHTTTMSYAAAAAASFANNPSCNSPLAHWIAAGSRYCSPPPILRLPACDLTPPELPLPTPTAAMGELVELEHYQGGGLERLVHSLPARPLGLNLSFQGFGVAVDDGGTAKDDCADLLGSLPLTQPSPAASYSYSPPAVETAATTHACGRGSPSPAALSATDAENANEKHSVIDAPAAAALVPVLDGGEMVMARQASAASTGGETQGVEWNEAAAADVAAWWSKIFESVESGQRASPNAEEDVAAAAPGLLPAEWRWLCGDDVGLGLGEQQGAVTGGKPSPDVLGAMMRVDDGDGDGDGDYSCCYEGGCSDDGDDVALPRMDSGIGDDTEEGWDGEWFSSS